MNKFLSTKIIGRHVKKIRLQRAVSLVSFYSLWAELDVILLDDCHPTTGIFVVQVFAVCNSSCGKVRFSQACVKNSVPWGRGMSATLHAWIHTPPPPRSPLQRLVCTQLECILVKFCEWSISRTNDVCTVYNVLLLVTKLKFNTLFSYTESQEICMLMWIGL